MSQLFTHTCTTQTTSWLVQGWSNFDARKSHEHTWTHKNHHNLDLGETITFPLIVFSVISDGGYIHMSFCPGTPKLVVSKFANLGLLAFWRAITSRVNLRLKWSLKQSYSLHWFLSNDMCHTTWRHVFQSDFWRLVVGSQIGTLMSDLSFGYTLCFKYSNGSWKPILDI
jgi:hypothetical protein